MSIWREMQKQLDGELSVKIMKTSNKCKHLVIQKKIKVGDKKEYIEKTLLFNRLIIMSQRDEGIQEIFHFELAPVPASPFTMDHMMRKPQKHEFGRMLMETTTFTDNKCMLLMEGGNCMSRPSNSSSSGGSHPHFGIITRSPSIIFEISLIFPLV